MMWKIISLIQLSLFFIVLDLALDLKINWWMTTSIVLSLVIVLMVWYIHGVLKRFTEIQEKTESLLIDFDSFNQHLEEIYGMTMFHGEPTLYELLEHSKKLALSVDDYMSFILDEETEENQEEEDITSDKKERKKKEKEEQLFHKST